MGAIQLQSAAFPRTLQREAESLSREKDSELQAAGLRSLAARLEHRRPELAIHIYGLLADSPTTPEEHRQVARDRFAALQGQGSGGARWEALIGRFLPEATDYHSIVPMMVAGSVSGLVRAAALGRFSTGLGSWLSRGLAARAAAGGLAFAAEVPAFTLSGRALHALGGQPSEAPLGRDLAAAALSLGCLKGFVGLGAKLSPRSALSTGIFAPAGLYTAHGIEERIGWRAPSDSASRALDAITASLSLGIGARFGRDLAGEGFHRRLSEVSMRAELAQARPLPELRMPWLPEPILMTTGSGDGKLPESTEGSRSPEAAAPIRTGNFSFKKYREIFSLTLMGDPVHNIESRLAGSADPVRVLELNPGDGTAVQELKQRFGDRVVIETVKDREKSGDFLKADFGEQRYDLILSLFGPAVAEGQLSPIFQKAVDHLLPGGEFATARTVHDLRHSEVSAWRKIEGLPVIGAAIQQGLLLRSERAAGNYLLYAQRIGASGSISLEKILQNSAPAKPSVKTLAYLERQLENQTLSGAGQQWRLERSAASRIAECLLELGAQEALILWPNLPQLLLNRFQVAFEKSHHRLPAAHEIQHWIDGREPSALWSKELFVDEWLGLQRDRARELAGSNPIPKVLLGVGLGLSSVFEPSPALAAGWEEHLPSLGHFSPLTMFLAGAGLLGAAWLARRAFRASQPKVNFPIGNQVPPHWAFTLPANDQGLLRRSNAPFFNGSPEPSMEEMEVVQTGSGARWYVAKPAQRRRGWVKAERSRIFGILKKSHLQQWERELALRSLQARLLELNEDSEINDAAKLMWDLAFAPRAGAEGRRFFKATYAAFITSPRFFDRALPQVFRECLRLRHIFSDPLQPLDRRISAVQGYAFMVRHFDHDQPLARAEARMAKDALADFLGEGILQRGARNFMVVNGTWLDIDQGLFLWKSGKRNGLKAGNEDWEGSY